MAGRPRLPISTFGAITTTKVGPDRYRATTVFRDWDGQSRQVGATRSSRNAAQTALKVTLAARTADRGVDRGIHSNVDDDGGNAENDAGLFLDQYENDG